MKKSILFIFMLLCSLPLRAQIPASMTGNWISESGNEWEYGFFEHFAIYDTDFWEYESVAENGRKTSVVLRNGDRTLSLVLSPGREGGLTVRREKEKAQSYRKMEKVYPRYQVYDGEMFPEPTFRVDSATLIGYYHGFDRMPEHFRKDYGTNYVTVTVSDFITSDEIDYLAALDSQGRFEITIPLLNTQEIFLDWGRLTKNIVLQPGDRQFLFVEMSDFYPQENESWQDYRERDKEILFMGTNARLNNELMQYKSLPLHVDFYGEREKGLKGMDYLRFCEDIYRQKGAHFDNYVAEYPAVSERFRFYTDRSEQYEFAGDLMQHRFQLNNREGERFPEGYMEYVEEHFPLDDERVYTLTRYFSWFVRDYIGYLRDENGPVSVTVTPKDAAEELEREGLLTPEAKKDIEEFIRLDEWASEQTDPEKVQEMASSPETAALLARINSNTLLFETLNRLGSSRFFEIESDFADSLLMPLPVLRELWLSHIYYKKFDNLRVPLTSRELTVLNDCIRNPYYRDYLLGLNDYYAELQKQTIDESSLKDTSHLEGIFDASELFARLTEPYRGKVIYLDFWGTWCGPCRENMKLMTGIKQELAGKEIVFIYLANNSPEATWRNVIKEMGLTGENVVHYRLPGDQQEILERHFSINAFPTYMIIAPDGTILNSDAPSPREKEKLFSALDDALGK